MSPDRTEAGARERRALTGLRGVLALWIVLYYAMTLADSPAVVAPSARWFGLIAAAPFAVDMFFMLSGFVLTLRHHDDRFRLRPFLVRRFARIYPLHAVALLALVVMTVAAPRLGVTMSGASASFLVPADLPYQFLLLQGFLLDRPSWNFPAWPLSFIALCYLVLPIALPRVARAPAQLLAIALVLALLASIAIAVSFDEAVAGFAGTGRAVSAFLSGSFAFLLIQSRVLPRGAAEVAAIALVLLAAFDAHPALLAPFGVLLIVALAEGEGALCRFLSTGALHWLGTISYSVILWQIPVYLVVRKLAAPFAAGIGALGFLVLYLAIVLAVSQLSYRLIERGARRWIIDRFAA